MKSTDITLFRPTRCYPSIQSVATIVSKDWQKWETRLDGNINKMAAQNCLYWCFIPQKKFLSRNPTQYQPWQYCSLMYLKKPAKTKRVRCETLKDEDNLNFYQLEAINLMEDIEMVIQNVDLVEAESGDSELSHIELVQKQSNRVYPIVQKMLEESYQKKTKQYKKVITIVTKHGVYHINQDQYLKYYTQPFNYDGQLLNGDKMLINPGYKMIDELRENSLRSSDSQYQYDHGQVWLNEKLDRNKKKKDNKQIKYLAKTEISRRLFAGNQVKVSRKPKIESFKFKINFDCQKNFLLFLKVMKENYAHANQMQFTVAIHYFFNSHNSVRRATSQKIEAIKTLPGICQTCFKWADVSTKIICFSCQDWHHQSCINTKNIKWNCLTCKKWDLLLQYPPMNFNYGHSKFPLRK